MFLSGSKGGEVEHTHLAVADDSETAAPLRDADAEEERAGRRSVPPPRRTSALLLNAAAIKKRETFPPHPL